MKTSNTLSIFITPIKGEEICIEKACTLKQAVTLARKEARKAIHNGGIFVTINIIARVSYGVETLAHIEAEKQGRRVAFSDDQPGENNAIAETSNEEEATTLKGMAKHTHNRVMSAMAEDTCSVAFLTEYISRQRKAIETPNPELNNTPTTMNANDIRRLERRLKAIEATSRTKSINGIMNQANRLMSVCNAVQNFKRADAIRAIAFRYYDNIRAYVGRFNYNDDSEYDKEYSRAQYMNA